MTSLRKRSLSVFPAGSNGEFDLPPELALVIARGEGCRLWDEAGREFLDFSMGWGSALVGHARPEVVAAVTRQAALGSNFACVTEPALALAEEIVRLSPACEQIRFCASGTEATMYCQRLARAVTGRPKILKFEGAYHGANEVGVASLFPVDPPDFPDPAPTGGGLAQIVGRDVLVAPFNHLATTRDILARHGPEIAGIIVEPLQRCTPPRPGFLEGVKAAAQAAGALLIFDEVVTGFRLAYGGAQAYYGVVPDLVAYGKALGGCYPIGAFGGSRALMAAVREDRLGAPDYMWVASTLGGNPVSASAAGAALAVFRKDGIYERLHALGRYLRNGMARVLQSRQESAQVIGDGPLAQIVFSTVPVVDYRSTLKSDRARARKVMLALFGRGVFLNPMGTKLYLSLAHDEAACDAFLDRFDDALGALS